MDRGGLLVLIDDGAGLGENTQGPHDLCTVAYGALTLALPLRTDGLHHCRELSGAVGVAVADLGHTGLVLVEHRLGIAGGTFLDTGLVERVVGTKARTPLDGANAVEQAEHGSNSRLVVVSPRSKGHHKAMDHGIDAPQQRQNRGDDRHGPGHVADHQGQREQLQEHSHHVDGHTASHKGGQVRLCGGQQRGRQKVGTGSVVVGDNHHRAGLLTVRRACSRMTGHDVLARALPGNARDGTDAVTLQKEQRRRNQAYDEHDHGEHVRRHARKDADDSCDPRQKGYGGLGERRELKALVRRLKAVLVEDDGEVLGRLSLLTGPGRRDVDLLHEIAHSIGRVSHRRPPLSNVCHDNSPKNTEL